MAKLYTVEPFSTYSKMIVERSDADEYYINLYDQIPEKITHYDTGLIFLDNVSKPEVCGDWLGRRRHMMVKQGTFEYLSPKKLILKESRKKDNRKFILSRYKKFKVYKGDAHYMIIPEENHTYVLIQISPHSILCFYGDPIGDKIVKWKDLK